MDKKTQLLLLYDLQQLDSALDALKKLYGALDQGKAEQEAHEATKAAHKEADGELKVVQAAIRDAELEQQTIEAKKKEEEAKLYGGQVRAPKELLALQDEVEILDRRRGAFDEKLVILLEGLETRRKRAAQTKQEHSATTAALRAKIAAFNKDTETMRAQALELSKQRAAAAAAVPPELLQRYDRLRPTKNGIAIVAIVDGNTCGGCNMGLPSSVVTRVHEGSAIVLCDNCERLLCDKR